MKIQVTQEDIRYGQQGSAKSCAVALALHRAGFRDVAVGGRGIYYGKTLNYNDLVPFEEGTRAWVHLFDREKSCVAPMEFELDIERFPAECFAGFPEPKVPVEIPTERMEADEAFVAK